MVVRKKLSGLMKPNVVVFWFCVSGVANLKGYFVKNRVLTKHNLRHPKFSVITDQHNFGCLLVFGRSSLGFVFLWGLFLFVMSADPPRAICFFENSVCYFVSIFTLFHFYPISSQFRSIRLQYIYFLFVYLLFLDCLSNKTRYLQNQQHEGMEICLKQCSNQGEQPIRTKTRRQAL